MKILPLVSDNVNNKLFAFGIIALALLVFTGIANAASGLSIRLDDAKFVNKSTGEKGSIVTFRDGDYAAIEMRVCVDSDGSTPNLYETVYGKLQSYGVRPDGTKKDFGYREASASIKVNGCQEFNIDLPGAASSEFGYYTDFIYLKFANQVSYGSEYKILTANVAQGQQKPATPKCSDISLTPGDFSMDEGTSRTVYFGIRNNNGYDFIIEDAYAYDYDSTIPLSFTNKTAANKRVAANGGYTTVDFYVTAGNVDNETIIHSYAMVKGRFDGAGVICDYRDIGYAKFSVTAKDKGAPPAYLGCGDISVSTQDFYINEGSTQSRTFSITNSGSKAFNAGISVSREYGSFSVSGYGSTLSVPAGSTKSFDVTVSGDSVSGTSKGRAKVNVSGNCTGSIPAKYFYVTVYDTASYPDYPQCGNIDIQVGGRTLEESRDNETLQFYIKNNSGEGFGVRGIEVTESNPYFNATAGGYDTYIGAGETGYFNVNVDTYNVSGTESGTVNVRVAGYFTESGKGCNYGDIGTESFTLTVNDEYYYDYSNSECNQIEWVTGTKEIKEGTTDTFTYRLGNNSGRTFYLEGVEAYETSGSKFDARVLDSSDYSGRTIYDGDYITVEVEIDADSVSSTTWGTLTLRARGHFSGNAYCNYRDIYESTSIKVMNTGTSSESANCHNIYLDTHTVEVYEDGSTIESFYVRNNSGSRFTISDVEIAKLYGSFSANIYPSVDDYGGDYIYSGNRKEIRVKFFGSGVSSTSTGKARLKVSGRLSNGDYCYFSGLYEDFGVKVKDRYDNGGSDNGSGTGNDCTDFTLTVPNEVAFSGNSGTIQFTVTNPLDKGAEITLSGAGLTISQDSFTVGRNSTTTKSIDITSDRDVAYVIYSTEISGCNIGNRTTKITFNSGQGAGEGNEEEATEISVGSFPTSMSIGDSGNVAVTVTNESAGSVEVKFSLEGFPEDWEITGGTKTIAAGDSVSLSASVKPKGTGTFTGKMIVEGGGKHLERALTLTIEEPAQQDFIATGLAMLSENAVVLGLVVIIIILVGMILYIQARK
ncbi:MAG: hypothetical protein V1676_03260 [Candidatus Diapherotrites archaeon]